jgi:hypothetical protein
MLVARCWIKKKIFIIKSSISPRRRLYEPEARDQYPVSTHLLHQSAVQKLDINFKILSDEDT